MTNARTISDPPVIEAVSEIRFENVLPSAVIFGKLYEHLSAEYSDVETLPILEMPEHVIRQQPDLKYAVHYRMKSDKYVISIGSNVLAISRICNSVPYDSWAEYKVVIDKVFSVFQGMQITNQVSRPSVKYINFYPGEATTIESKLKYKLETTVSSYEDLNINFSTKLDDTTALSVAVGAKAQITNPPFNKERGLLFVIEASGYGETPLEDVLARFESLHQHVEDTFFAARAEEN